MTFELPATKAEARRVIREQRRARRDSGDTAGLADRYAATLLGWLAQRTPGTITAYESWATEPPTTGLLPSLAQAGWRVLVPLTLADRDLSWREFGSEVDLGKTAIATADVIVVPALAVDLDGYRLGQGGGSYDRTLPRARPEAPVLAMVFEQEIVVRVPREPHDRRVDAVLTASAVRPLA
ncbi:5-formyltetrahydrofolate cyclo-ligase [Calidifontibacter terrae]